MASLSDVYERKRGGGGHASPRRVYLGVSLFLVGVLMALIGVVVASTEVLTAYDIGRFESRRIAGVLGGIGVPAVFIGILTVLPASDRIRGATAIGAGVALVGVALYWTVYPSQWLGANVDRHYTFETATIYTFGLLVVLWCFFVAVANFKTRNDPGGTVDLEIRTAGNAPTMTISADSLRPGWSGIGFLGSSSPTPDAPVSDGGQYTTELSSPLDQPIPSTDEGVDVISHHEPTRHPVDRYCGNCTHFDYVRDGGSIKPYCGHRQELMADMQPCDAWMANHAGGTATQ